MQCGFTCGYVQFIVTNLSQITHISVYWFGLLCLLCFIPIVFVRKIEKFAYFHIAADCVIFATILICSITAGESISANGKGPGVVDFNSAHYISFCGFAIYVFEGIGLIIPIQEAMINPNDFRKVITFTVAFVASLYFFFGSITYYAYGTDTQSPITLNLDPKSPIAIIIIGLYCINLLITYALQSHPAYITLESLWFKNWPKSKKRMWTKNLTRSILVCITVVAGVVFRDSMDMFLSLIGSIACTPLAFIMPAWFHYKIVAKSKLSKGIDLFIVIFATFLMLFTTTTTMIEWVGGAS